MKQIAICGKGGIGKSTIAANLSAALGLAGLNVLQVGCDPKQDSTRLLLQGRTVRTALDYLREVPPPGRRLQEVVHAGFAGVSCVEAGGPEPGIGCAGRGILSTFELLKQLGINACRYDLAVYDVLGDVVCGGFAVPLRYEYADAVYIVTSGEFMALYAGNNILRGVRNYEGRGPRSCAFLSSLGLASSARRLRERYGTAVSRTLVPTLHCSEMDERMLIFGGNASLEATLRQAVQEHPAALLVVTTCAAGIIGDDPRLPLAAVRTDLGPMPALLVQADGDITGDYSQGILDAMITVAEELKIFLNDAGCADAWQVPWQTVEADLLFADGYQAGQRLAAGNEQGNIELMLPLGGDRDLVPKPLLGAEGTAYLVERILNSVSL